MSLSGVIDTTTLTEFEKRLQETMDDGVDRLLLDLEKVRYINSSGFGALVKYSDQFKSRGGGLGLVLVPPKVQVVLEMLGLQAFFPIYPTQEVALTAISGAGEGFPAPEAAAEPAPAPQAPPAPAAPAAPAPAAPAAPTARVPTPEVETAATFPMLISCGTCCATLDVKGQGTYRCPGCSTPFKVGSEGHVSFPEVAADATAIQIVFDTRPGGRRILQALVANLASTHLAGRSTGEMAEALEEICDWIQGGPGQTPMKVSVLAVAGGTSLRLDFADSGTERNTGDLRRATGFFSRVTHRRLGGTRNLTRAVLAPAGSDADAAAAEVPLVESRS
jgi:anti-anti-sigma factor